MPLWRRGLHGLRGFFNEAQYGPSADWEYWLRCADGGSRYYHTPEPLGLYLKREDSYWHQDPSARRFDQVILARYGPIVASGAFGQGLHALPWLDLSRFIQTDNWFGVMLCLVRLNALPDDSGLDVAATRKLAAAHARRYFGLAQFEPLAPELLHAGVSVVLARLQSRLLDWLHAFLAGAKPDDTNSARAASGWRSLLVDWHLLDGSVMPLIGLALMQRRLGRDAKLEHKLLHGIHAQDPEGFWRGLQQVYRFAVPLEEIVRAVGALRLPHAGIEKSTPARLVYFPDYTRTNRYQDLLYWGCRRPGIQVEPAADLAALETLVPQAGCANIVHLYWLNAAFNDPGLSFEQAAEHFLRVVRGLKDRGFAVYWTVHNRLNHDCTQPQAEARLRAELAEVVDRVYLHHPLLAYQLDWLPDKVRPWLCEHGPYVNAFTGGIDRTLARQRLGLAADERVLLWFGQIRPYKGLEDWLPVILERLAEYGKARLVVAGRISSPEVRDLLERYPDQTLFINRFVPNFELQHLACAADFGLLTYRAILTSGAMFHLYGMGLPVIAPDKGSLPAYVVPGWNGLLYRDQAELANALERVCATTNSELARYRAGAERTGRGMKWGRITA
ncbi:glycosyltransferase [Wenzhouxiangella limi]|uniref:Glycosyltransferase n=1 Tax=Wenzhouxiangella limi TaxID=2707351 RepID=A0A845V502_9GAMM|nr:glycosyltransferase [Wenzhouxiangella limi]NDY95301.1 glycosyltransferase [Wenzhouxiangella limi]